MDNKEKISREKILSLLEGTTDCSLTIDPKNSDGYQEIKNDVDPNQRLILTRSDLERLITTSRHIAFSSFHSSGINNAGNHVSG